MLTKVHLSHEGLNAMEIAIAYLRVSSEQQGKSGLGLEAQTTAIERFARDNGFEITSTFTEIQSGKGANALERRPQLAAAMKAAKKAKGYVLVSKLDRLSRDVHFISGLMAHKVRFKAADLPPDADPFMLHIYAAVAEHERKRIGDRTRDALAAARKRGVKLGNPALAKSNKATAVRRAGDLGAFFRETAGMSASAAARWLNKEGQAQTPTGAPWSAKTVLRVRERLGI
jgi:DNA invertase Pin-like site-specific DNA recombinase